MLKMVIPAAKSPSWVLKKFAMGRANYWISFVVDALTAMFFLTWDISQINFAWGTVVIALCSGYVLWSFTEYIFHSWIYHHATGIFGEGHQIHHDEAKSLIAMPWVVTTVTMFGLWHYCASVAKLPFFSSLQAGWLLGFVFYSLVHHSHHHWNIKLGWFRRLKAYHRIHHHFPEYNYGVTMRFWDIVFNTRFKKRMPYENENVYQELDAIHKMQTHGQAQAQAQVQRELVESP